MGISEILQLAAQFGPMGLLVGYLILRESSERKDRREIADKRAEIDKADTSSRLELARSLTALTMVIHGRSHV